MDIRKLEIFLKLLETKSFSKTAQALNLTQPTVSASLKALEESLGQKLFERSPRTMQPLPAAQVLEPYAFDIVQKAGQAAWAVSRQLRDPKEMLSLGASSVPAIAFMPRLLKLFSNEYPNILIKLKSGHSRNLADKVADGELDLALVGAKSEREELQHHEIGQDNLILLCSETLAKQIKKAPAGVNDLLQWPLIIREEGSGTRQALMKAMAGLDENLCGKLSIKAEVEGLAASIALVRASLGATVISSLMPPFIKMDGLSSYSLDFLGTRRFYLVRKKTCPDSPAIEALLKILKDSPQTEGKAGYQGRYKAETIS